MADVERRFFKLINNEIIFGEIEILDVKGVGQQILIKKPFTVVGTNAIPYMYNVMKSSPAAIQIHPINVLWSVSLDEFEDVNKSYIELTTEKSSIITGL